MDSRDLKSLVIVQALQAGQDAIGQPTTTWATFKTLRANIRYLNGVETIKADAQTSVVKASIRIRRRTDITAAMRVVFGTTTFEIKAVLPDEQDRERLDLACEVVT
ncbi:MAG: phage head closure protein [Pseudomonadota bacterium]